MKIIAINGSPRKKGNTATLLCRSLDGAASQGAETKLVHLYDLTYKGCVSCFSCKRKDGESYGRCAYRDELSPLLEEIQEADAFVLGSPIYFDEVSGSMRSFLERLLFPVHTYTTEIRTLAKKEISIGYIYTMNETKERMVELGYPQILKFVEDYLVKFYGYCETLGVYNTYQFSDYTKYVNTRFDGKEKAKVLKEQFPLDCQKAYDLGARLIQNLHIV